MFLFCTFGSGQPGYPGYVRLEGPSWSACREAMHKYTNGRFMTDYPTLEDIHPLDKIERAFLVVTTEQGDFVEGYHKTQQNALEMAHACGLQTVGEAIANIKMHAGSIYPYGEIPQRLQDLRKAFECYTHDAKVNEILGEARCKALDDEMTLACGGDVPLADEQLEQCKGENCSWPEFGHSKECAFAIKEVL
jgi:hypothetical protein